MFIKNKYYFHRDIKIIRDIDSIITIIIKTYIFFRFNFVLFKEFKIESYN
jgi:hypothetical protein